MYLTNWESPNAVFIHIFIQQTGTKSLLCSRYDALSGARTMSFAIDKTPVLMKLTVLGQRQSLGNKPI